MYIRTLYVHKKFRGKTTFCMACVKNNFRCSKMSFMRHFCLFSQVTKTFFLLPPVNHPVPHHALAHGRKIQGPETPALVGRRLRPEIGLQLDNSAKTSFLVVDAQGKNYVNNPAALSITLDNH